MAKRFSSRRLSKNRHYTYDDAFDVLGVSKNTLRAWREKGLPVMTETRPHLILGEDLIAFLDARQKPGRKTKLDEFRCFKCQALRRPAGGIVTYEQIGRKSGRLGAECATCGTICFKFFNPARLTELARIVEVVTKGAS